MFVESLKIVGWVVGGVIFLALWLSPDPIGKVVEIWRFFREG